MNNLQAQCGPISLELNPETLCCSVTAEGKFWQWDPADRPRIQIKDGKTVWFSDALNISHSPWNTGVGRGIRSFLTGFQVDGREISYQF